MRATSQHNKSLRLLSQGAEVSRLHRLFVSLGHDIAETERRSRRFGNSTRQAVIAFQTENDLEPTGIADSDTLTKLKRQVSAMEDDFTITPSDIDRTMPKIGTKLRDWRRSDNPIAQKLQRKLMTALKKRFLNLFRQPSEALVAAVNELTIDLDAVEDMKFSDFVFTSVVPTLLDNASLERELFRIGGKRVKVPEESIRELLGLDLDVRISGEYQSLVNRTRNAAIGDVLRLPDDAIDVLGEVNVLDEDEELARLVGDGALSEGQRDDILFVADVARLTDDNFTAIRALRAEGVLQSRDLVSRDEQDWLRFIERHGIEPPEDETPETFARLLNASVERSFFTAYTLTHYANRVDSETIQRLSILDRIPESDVPIFIDGSVNKNLDLAALPEEEAREIRSELSELARFGNRFTGLGMTDILNDRTMSTRRKRLLIRRRQRALSQVLRLHPDLDLNFTNFFPIDDPTARGFNLDLEGIETADQPYVLSALKSLQRVGHMTNSYEESDKLMAAGLDSAAKVAAVSDVRRLAAMTGVDKSVAMRIRARALETRLRVSHFIHGLDHATTHSPSLPAILKETTPTESNTLINVLKDIPGYEELFGPQNYCACRHCQSLFSPAAYFVDLMRFIDRIISTPNFKDADLEDHPLSLQNRRSDLWSIPLTCENTDTLVLYLTIVNEVLEAYLERVAALPGDVFEFLATDARSSFQQPFNLPHAELLLFLQHLGVTLSSVSALYSEVAAAHTILNVSPQELQTITTAEPSAVRVRFGKEPSAESISTHDTSILSKLMKVDRQMLERLLSVSFVVTNLKIEAELATLEPDDLSGFTENIQITMLDDSEVTEDILRAFLDRLHRFERLRRAVDWTPEELQLVLDAFQPAIVPSTDESGAILNTEMVDRIAQLYQLMNGMKLSVSEAVALVHEIPDQPVAPDSPSLWTQLFGDRKTLVVRHTGLDNTESMEEYVSVDFGLLQGALRLDEPHILSLLRRQIPRNVLRSGTLTPTHLHRLFRSARLASALRISDGELAALEHILPALGPQTLGAQVPSRERLDALTESLTLSDQFSNFKVSLGDLLAYLDLAALESHRTTANALLNEIRDELREDEGRWLTPGDLARIEGITLEAARFIIRHLASRDEPWLIRLDDPPERYVVTDVVGEEPDELVLQEVLSVAGAPLGNLNDNDHSVGFLVAALQTELVQHRTGSLLHTTIATKLEVSSHVLLALDPLVTHLSALLQTDASLMVWLEEDSPTPLALLNWMTELVRLKRLFIETLNATSDSIAFVANQQALFGMSPEEGWTWSVLRRVSSFAHAHRKAGELASDLENALLGWNGTTFEDSSLGNLAKYVGVNASQMTALLTELPNSSDVFNMLQRIEDGVQLSRRTGLDPAALRLLVSENYTDMLTARNLVLGAMRSKHANESTWHTVQAPFLEKAEGLKRDALVDRVLSRRQLGFDNERDIYHFFLLDSEMDGCFKTSRVKNAITSCQLYVQRCFMGLEQSKADDNFNALSVKVANSDKTREEWKWRKNYRVWEANRKVFLYPENYLLPDLRDDKSHIFNLIEGNLLQGNLDSDSIDEVFRRYVSEFSHISDMEIVHVLFEKEEGYLIFGRTRQEPYRYFMRRLNGHNQWEPWQSIDMDIGARSITAVRHRERLYVFWTNVDLDSDSEKINDAQLDSDEARDLPPGNEEGEEDPDISSSSIPIIVTYTKLSDAGTWSTPQDILFYNLETMSGSNPTNELRPHSDRVYAEFPNSQALSSPSYDFIRLVHPVFNKPADKYLLHYGYLREGDQTIKDRDGDDIPPLGLPGLIIPSLKYPIPDFRRTDKSILKNFGTSYTSSAAAIDNVLSEPIADVVDRRILNFTSKAADGLSLQFVQSSGEEAVLKTGRSQFLIQRTGEEGSDVKTPASLEEALLDDGALVKALSLAQWKLVRLDGWRPSELSERLLEYGIEALLSPDEQLIPERRAIDKGITFPWLGQMKGADEDRLGDSRVRARAQFGEVHGPYMWELYFHVPYLIAHTLNSIGKFEQADFWYRRIFDPTAAGDNPHGHWRFVVFQTLTIPKLREILTNKAAIDTYASDPFNPFSIARFRPSAFQKAIVMRYIDNLLDWGDDLFRQDTRESINEALLLYIMAADLLGERPLEVGECETEVNLSYASIEFRHRGGEFLIELENFVAFYRNLAPIIPVNPSSLKFEFVSLTVPGLESDPLAPNQALSGLRAVSKAGRPLWSYTAARANRAATYALEVNAARDNNAAEDIAPGPVAPDPDPPAPDPGIFDYFPKTGDDQPPDEPITQARTLGFCVPPNAELLHYWDRVEDRLHKLRHCMNIEGVERQLPLWQPPIDPLLLVRAKAAGLDLDDVLALVNEQPPHHRFDVLLERARRFTVTAQQLGSQLLSALERKDEGELILLRSVHEDTILTLSRTQKDDAIKEAEEAVAHLKAKKLTIEARRDHYKELIKDGTIEEEDQNTSKLDEANTYQTNAADAEAKAHPHELAPQWTTGTSFEIGVRRDPKNNGPRWGFVFEPPTGIATGSVSYGSSNIIARFRHRASRNRDIARVHSHEAGMSEIKSRHKRRLEEWEMQKTIADMELDELVPQKLAADIRLELAERELTIHDEQMKNSRELYEFASERFTSLGLYTYLSTTLGRLSREAYDMAFRMAQAAERAYQFEIGEGDFFLKFTNWDASRAGLLAADRLLLQLQAMEASHVERDRRRQEVTLPCSLSQIDPNALVHLRQTGSATFMFPEWWFDLFYPGQYRRILNAVRLTIPCVTGPYSNVGAKLTLVDSAIRSTPSTDTNALVGVQVGRNTSISTSSANSDPGVFELRFDSPMIPPFKGAGAVSSWVLELPSVNRVFDYSSISDVIIELSYTAEDDGLLRNVVEGSTEQLGSIDEQLESGLVRTFSLRHEFPSHFHNLMSMGQDPTEPIDLSLRKAQHFPYWVGQRPLQITQVDIGLEPKSGRVLSLADIQGIATIVLNGESLSNWAEAPNLGSLPVTSSTSVIELGDDPVVLSIATLLPNGLELHDLLIRLTYSTSV